MSTPPRILALWSAPRSRSTAFFRMMVERGDFTAVHEPFSSRAEHGSVTIGGAVARTERDVVEALRVASRRTPVFFKDTTDERYADVLSDERLLANDARHTFIVRHPRETIPSYYALNPKVTSSQIGFETLHELFLAVWGASGERPVVVDAGDLVERPEAIVAAYCSAVGIPYLPHALAWKPGDRGEWRATERWHVDVSRTARFGKDVRSHDVKIDDYPHLGAYLRQQLPFYERLLEHRIG